MRLEGGHALISTTSRKIGIPRSQFNSLEKLLRIKLNCKEANDSLYCSCISGNTARLPNVTLHFGGQSFILQPEGYINMEENRCLLMFEPSYNGGWVLGLPFFRDNLVVFEHERVLIAEVIEVNPIGDVPIILNIDL
jgi:hypothetical protein